MPDPIDIAERDQAQAMAAQCGPILYGAWRIAVTAGKTTEAIELLFDQTTGHSPWSTLDAMAFAIEMMRQRFELERRFERLLAAAQIVIDPGPEYTDPQQVINLLEQVLKTVVKP